MPADQLLSLLSCTTRLKQLNLIINCQLQPNEIKKILGALKQMKYLQHVDLSENKMGSDAVTSMASMIKNNEHMQSLALPNCILDKKDLKIIIQAMQAVSSLQYVNFSNNILDNELACDIALLITKNSELKELKFSELILYQSGFQYLSTHLVKVKGLTTFNITGCSFTEHNAVTLVAAISDNSEIQKLNLSSCTVPVDQLLSSLSSATKLKGLNLSNCFFEPNEVEKVFSVLKEMKCLKCVDLSKNKMKNNVVNDIAAMIKNNEHIQSLSLPNCVLDQEDLRIIFQAMQTVSIKYVDFSNNILDNNLAYDVALIYKSHTLMNLKFSKLALCESGFEYLKNHLVRLKGLIALSIINCSFTPQDAVKLETVIINNSIIQEITLSNCKIPANQLCNMLSCATELKWLKLFKCHLEPNDIKDVFGILKKMNHLRHVDLSENRMDSDAVDEVAAIIKHNKHIQSISLPKCSLNPLDYVIIIKAMQTVSSLQYVELTHLVIIEGIKIIGCASNDKDVLNLEAAINNNSEIEELDLSLNRMPCEINMLHIFSKLKTMKSLKCLKLHGITVTDQIEKEIMNVSHQVKCFELTGCNLKNDFITKLTENCHRVRIYKA